MILAGVVGAAPVSAATAKRVAPMAVTTENPPPTQAADPNTAMALAVRYGVPVEVTSTRTESAQTFAQPDGVFKLRQSASPERVKKGNTWVPIDTDLRVSGSVVVPKAATLDVRFSNGGSTPMVKVAKGSLSLSVTWPGTLPRPSIDGDTATYAEVMPGVDLKLTAQVDSFSQVLVVKTPEAAATLNQIHYGLSSAGLTVEQDPDTGYLTAVDPYGKQFFGSDGAKMWDTPVIPAVPGRVAGAAGRVQQDEVDPGDVLPEHSSDIPVTLTDSTLTVTPDPEMLASDEVTYPLYIDPGWDGGKSLWTVVNRAHPTTSYWSSDYYRDSMRVGQSWHSSSDDDWRTIALFDVKPLRGTDIRSAAVIVDVQHSASCAKTPLQLWRTNKIYKSEAVTWNSTKDKYWERLAEVSAMANKHVCPAGDDQVAFDQKAVREAFQSAADKQYETITFGFRAKSESDDYQWKKLRKDSAYLEISYNHRPDTPNTPEINPCFVCTQPATTWTDKPQLRVHVADDDGGKLSTEFEVWSGTHKTLLAHYVATGIGTGNLAKWSPSTGVGEGDRSWRARACDSYDCSSWTSWQNVKVDTTNPAAPVISSVEYPDDGVYHGGVGELGTFDLAPGPKSEKIISYDLMFNGEAAITLDADEVTGRAHQPYKPPLAMRNQLMVRVRDSAGNNSGWIPYYFLVSSVEQLWHYGLDDDLGPHTGSAPVNDQPLTASAAGVTWADDGGRLGSSGSALFDGTGQLTAASPVLDTSLPAGFSVAAWVRLPVPEPSDAPLTPPPAPDPTEPDPGEGDDPGGEDSPPDIPNDLVSIAPPAQNQTAVSVDGATRSMFKLGYRHDVDVDADGATDPAWCFTVATADTASAPEVAVCTRQYVMPGDWVHLTGTVDMNKKIKLYVNGTAEGGGVETSELQLPAVWRATGAFTIGRAKVGAVTSEQWVGNLDEVHAEPRVMSPLAIDNQARSFMDGDV